MHGRGDSLGPQALGHLPRLGRGKAFDTEQRPRLVARANTTPLELGHPQVVPLQDVDDLQTGAALGIQHATRDDDGLGGVTGVDRVRQVPLGDVARVAQIRLDVAEVERRRSVDRLERPREGIDPSHVVTQPVGDLDRRFVINADAVLGHLGFHEGHAVGGARTDVDLHHGGRAFHEFVGLGAHHRQDQDHVGRRIVHPRQHIGDLVGEQRLSVANDHDASLDQKRRRIESFHHQWRHRLSPG